MRDTVSRDTAYQEDSRMQINITGRHIELTAPIEEYAQKKAERMERYFDRIQQVEVVIDKVKNGYDVEIVTDVEHHEPFVATNNDHDLYACIDGASDKMIRQLTDHKSKLRDNKHTHATGSEPNETS